MRSVLPMAFIAAGLLVTAPAGATPDHKEDVEAAKAVAADWLTLIDSRKYEESYDDMSAFTRKTIGRDDWVKIMTGTLSRVGAIQQRDVILANYTTSFPKAPPGDYVVIRTRITSDKYPDTTVFELLSELVVLVREGTGAWKVYGYLVSAKNGEKPLQPG